MAETEKSKNAENYEVAAPVFWLSETSATVASLFISGSSGTLVHNKVGWITSTFGNSPSRACIENSDLIFHFFHKSVLDFLTTIDNKDQ